MNHQRAIPSISLSKTSELLEKAKKSMETYESRVRPFVPEGYSNDTSPEVLAYLESVIAEKEARITTK